MFVLNVCIVGDFFDFLGHLPLNSCGTMLDLVAIRYFLTYQFAFHGVQCGTFP